jgi:hypothetical protein
VDFPELDLVIYFNTLAAPATEAFVFYLKRAYSGAYLG